LSLERVSKPGLFNYPSSLQRIAVILDRCALWSIDAYLEELRGKIGEAVKRAIPKSKVVWLNLTATRYIGGIPAAPAEDDDKQHYPEMLPLEEETSPRFFLRYPVRYIPVTKLYTHRLNGTKAQLIEYVLVGFDTREL
jgi:hypothetical protein